MEHIGETLLCLQSAEACVSFCLTWIFPPENVVTFDELCDLNKKETKATLGRMLKELRERGHVHPEFEKLLARFVKNRNLFIHKIFCEPDYIINSSENIKRGHKFLEQFRHEIWEVENIFGSYSQIWCETIGLTEFIREKNPAAIDNEDVKSVRKEFQFLLAPKRWGDEPKWKQMRKNKLNS